MTQSIVRARGGTQERTVRLSDIVVPDVPKLLADFIDQQWIDSASTLRKDVTRVLAQLRSDAQPTTELFVPNYWKAVIKLPNEQQEPMLELWHLAHDIGKEVFVVRHEEWRVQRNGVPGMLYHRP